MILKLLVSAYIYATVVDAVDYCSLQCEVNGKMEENSACNCDIAPACGAEGKPLPLSDDEKQYVVTLHNQLREKVANEEQANNIKAMVYDNDVAHTAQCHAHKCTGKHDPCRRTAKYEKVGQNYFGKGSTPPACGKEEIKAAINKWFSERKDCGPDDIQSFHETGVVIGHYTQQVWAATETVGCGRMQTVDYCYIYCNYGPSGNFLTEPVFTRGAVSCEHPEGFPHLCKGLEGDTGTGEGTSGGAGEGVHTGPEIPPEAVEGGGGGEHIVNTDTPAIDAGGGGDSNAEGEDSGAGGGEESSTEGDESDAGGGGDSGAGGGGDSGAGGGGGGDSGGGGDELGEPEAAGGEGEDGSGGEVKSGSSTLQLISALHVTTVCVYFNK